MKVITEKIKKLVEVTETKEINLCEDCSDEAVYLLREHGFKFQELED